MPIFTEKSQGKFMIRNRNVQKYEETCIQAQEVKLLITR